MLKIIVRQRIVGEKAKMRWIDYIVDFQRPIQIIRCKIQ